MAVEFKTPHTRTSEYLFLPEHLKLKPKLNGRHDAPEIEWLVKSMVRFGQLQPIGIGSDGGTPVVKWGASRWRAAVEINKRKLTPEPFRLRCVYVKMSEQDTVLANISENIDRNPNTRMDDARNIARLQGYGMTLEQIADHYHPQDEFGKRLEEKAAVKWVEKRLALVELSANSEEALRNGTVKPSAAIVLAKLSEEQQEFAIKQAKENGTTITAASLKAPKAPKAPKAKQTTIADAIDPQESKPDPETLYNVIASIAEGGEFPFEWEFDVDARKFCKELLKFVSE